MHESAAPLQLKASLAYGLSKYCKISGLSAAISVKHWSIAWEMVGCFRALENPSIS